jgi:hypothetical protein
MAWTSSLGSGWHVTIEGRKLLDRLRHSAVTILGVPLTSWTHSSETPNIVECRIERSNVRYRIVFPIDFPISMARLDIKTNTPPHTTATAAGAMGGNEMKSQLIQFPWVRYGVDEAVTKFLTYAQLLIDRHALQSTPASRPVAVAATAASTTAPPPPSSLLITKTSPNGNSQSSKQRVTSYQVNDQVDAFDITGQWTAATIIERNDKGQYRVHFRGLSSNYDEWLTIDKLAPLGTSTVYSRHTTTPTLAPQSTKTQKAPLERLDFGPSVTTTPPPPPPAASSTVEAKSDFKRSPSLSALTNANNNASSGSGSEYRNRRDSVNSSSDSNSKGSVVRICSSQLKKLRRWTEENGQYRDQIGGDLFGRWDGAIPIIEFVLGPGPAAKRFSASFYQDSVSRHHHVSSSSLSYAHCCFCALNYRHIWLRYRYSQDNFELCSTN